LRFSLGIIRIAAVLAAAVILAHMLPIHYFGPLGDSEINDVLHVLGFATLAFVAAHFAMDSLRSHFPSALVRYAIIGVMLAALGVAAEAAQYFTSRDANPFDVLRDFSGIAAGLSFHRGIAAGVRAGLAAAIVLLGLGLYQPVTALAARWHVYRAFPVLATFESALDLRAALPMSVDVQTVAAPPQWGGAGHVALLIPDARYSYHGLALTEMPEDWHEYSRLVFRASAAAATVLTVRINDEDYQGGFADRFNRDFEIGPRPQTITIALADVETGPRDRALNLREVERVAFYLDNRSEAFMLDDIRLE